MLTLKSSPQLSVLVSSDFGPRGAERDGPSEGGSDTRVWRQWRGPHWSPQPAKHWGCHAQLQRRETGKGSSEATGYWNCVFLSEVINFQHDLLQVMGCLADRKCVQGQRVSGILVKRNFNYHILTPSDLSSKYLFPQSLYNVSGLINSDNKR